MQDPIRAVFTNDAFDAAFRYAGNLCGDPIHAIKDGRDPRPGEGQHAIEHNGRFLPGRDLR